MELQKSVGKNGRADNRASDVALVQAALMLARDKTGKAYFLGPANGIAGQAFVDGLVRFKTETGDDDIPRVTPDSAAVRRLEARLPARYKTMRPVGDSSLLHVPERVRRAPPRATWPKPDKMPLPTGLKSELLAAFEAVWRDSGLTMTLISGVDAYSLTADGRFSVFLKVQGSKFVNSTSLALLDQVPAKLTSYFASALARKTSLWKVQEGKFGLVSKKAYPYLMAGAGTAFLDKSAKGKGIEGRCRQAVGALINIGGTSIAWRDFSGCFDTDPATDPAKAAFVERVFGLQLQNMKLREEIIAVGYGLAESIDAYLAYERQLPARNRILGQQADARKELRSELVGPLVERFIEQRVPSGPRAEPYRRRAKTLLKGYKFYDAADTSVKLISFLKNGFAWVDEELIVIEKFLEFKKVEYELRFRVSELQGESQAMVQALDLMGKKAGIQLYPYPYVSFEMILRDLEELEGRFEKDDPFVLQIKRFRLGLRGRFASHEQAIDQAVDDIIG